MSSCRTFEDEHAWTYLLSDRSVCTIETMMCRTLQALFQEIRNCLSCSCSGNMTHAHLPLSAAIAHGLLAAVLLQELALALRQLQFRPTAMLSLPEQAHRLTG